MSEEIKNILEKAREASRLVNLLSAEKINQVLCRIADAAVENTDKILKANAEDLARMDKNDPKYDRLLLTRERIAAISEDMRKVAGLPSPLGKVLAEWTQPNGMKISKVSVPFGVVGVIYEARPNVTFDVLSLCLKSGSAVIMKGGTDAYNSNTAITDVIHSVLREEGVSEAVATLFPPSHEATAELLNAVGYVDLIIPRGGRGLINFVRDNSRVPVIETGAGICHAYFHSSGDLTKGAAIVNNAKTRRVSVCNALDCLLVHWERLKDLPELCKSLADYSVTIYADTESYEALKGSYPSELLQRSTEKDYGTEYLDYKMSVCASTSLQGAVDHITKYGSGHSECIITEKAEVADYFTRAVDAACVYVNVPTAFTDGGEFGLGAEIGISTQKLHARGPMGLEELNTYKWVIHGEGQTRK
jgi:glutamate-5-semialdehyde dehydrogenase